MTLPRTIAEVLSEHVVFEVECIDRMYLNVYVPQLQFARGLVGYVHRQLGLPIASTATLAKITDRFAAAVHRFAADERIPWVDFAWGQRKDDVMHEHLAAFDAAGRTEGVLFIGRAQEKTPLFRTEKRRDRDGRSYPWIVKTTGLASHFYMYCVDGDFGPFFLKFCSYFPYNAKLCVNGNHWAQRQAARAGLQFEALDNGFAAVSDPPPCSRSATSSDRSRSMRCCANGWPGCHTRSPPLTAPPATGTTSRSCRPSSRSPRCSTSPCPGGCSSSRSSATTSVPDGPTRSASSSAGG
jgi:hypothetical protein